VRHAQAAQDWGLAVRSLSDRMLDLVLDGQGATARELLAGFPAGAVTADAELAALVAGDEVTRGSLEAAERHLTLATGGLSARNASPAATPPASSTTTYTQIVDQAKMPAVAPPSATAGLNTPPEMPPTAKAPAVTVKPIASPLNRWAGVPA
jgi:hypothetical protein